MFESFFFLITSSYFFRNLKKYRRMSKVHLFSEVVLSALTSWDGESKSRSKVLPLNKLKRVRVRSFRSQETGLP